jgi:hypothetical protein
VASAATAEIAMAWERITGGLKASRMPQWRTAQQQQRSRSQELPLHVPAAARGLDRRVARARGPRRVNRTACIVYVFRHTYKQGYVVNLRASGIVYYSTIRYAMLAHAPRTREPAGTRKCAKVVHARA